MYIESGELVLIVIASHFAALLYTIAALALVGRWERKDRKPPHP